MTFSNMGFSAPILKAVDDLGYKNPSPVQSKAIPSVIEGRDVMAAAQTGTGKTSVFTLPILERFSKRNRVQGNQVRALILTPTRELAAQIGENVVASGKYLPLSSTVVFGGVKINPQMIKLRGGVDVLVATPGRLLDLYSRNAMRFNQLEVLVLDEADRMLDMGFLNDIKKIMALLPKNRQTLMLSATFSNQIRALAKKLLQNPVEISVDPPNTAVEKIEQCIYPVDKKRKAALLTQLIKVNKWDQVLVFSKTKHGANKLTTNLEKAGVKAAAIHGNKSQGARTRALAEFKNGTTSVLVATDIASRGLDIDQLPHVINYDLPLVKEDYIHRIGRTGRAGSTGCAISLVCADEFEQLTDIERLLQELLTRKSIKGFEPVNILPESRLDGKPIKAKKPKKPKTGHQDGQRSGQNSKGHQSAAKNVGRRGGTGKNYGKK